MKKILLTAAMTAALQASAAFPSMLFHTSDGTDHIISTEGLKITYTTSELTAGNSAGAKLTLPLNSLEWMEFSDSEASTDEIRSTDSGEVTVFGTDGRKLGDYASRQAAFEALEKGVYIIRATNGSTLKISLHK